MVYSHTKFAYHPIKGPPSPPYQEPDSYHLLQRLGRKKSQSLFFLVFALLVAYILISVLLESNAEDEDAVDNPSTNYYDDRLSSDDKPSYTTVKSSDKHTEAYQVPYSDSSSDSEDSEASASSEEESQTTTPTQAPAKAPEGEDIACQIPKLNPFDPTIKHLIKAPDPINCTEKFPLLFESYPDSTIKPLTLSIRALNYTSCCYRTIHRRDNKDNGFLKSPECTPISLENATSGVWTPDEEYLAIYCQDPSKNSSKINGTLVDLHVTVPLKPDVEERIQEYYKNASNSDPPSILEGDRVNVVILGIDAVSHMNFQRTMPLSYEYLVRNLSAVGMEGFNKIGDNTYPNMAAVLASYSKEEMASCEDNELFDRCPLIWRRFADAGFRTCFGEDSSWMGMFNYLKRGFSKPPTDYYLRAFENAADDLIGTNKRMNAKLCQGPRLSFQVLLGYMEKFCWKMALEDKRYFQLIWATSLTHDYLNAGREGDKHLISTLKWFKEGGYLNKTVFILMSDHGIRWGEIRNFLQGQLEERLPFLYFVVPQWFQERYSAAWRNLEGNGRKRRLTTPYDLHSTLEDLLDLERLEGEMIKLREESLEGGVLPRGISQFLSIPKMRTCDLAQVPEHYCTCHQSKEIGVKEGVVEQLANFIVYSINLMISRYDKCAYLALEKVIRAVEIRRGFKNETAYQLVLETKPGGGNFESSVEKDDKHGGWKISGSISRTNLYGNQSHCVSVKEIKLYCYCLDVLENSIKK